MNYQIRCIVKADRSSPYEHIAFVGGLNSDGSRWKFSQGDVIKMIKNKTHSFYVFKDGKIVNVIVAISKYGNEYIKTEADGEIPNNLLSLPTCP